MALFVMNCILLSCRFYLRPGAFTSSFTDQVESLFIPAFVSLATSVENKRKAPWKPDLTNDSLFREQSCKVYLVALTEDLPAALP